jgi:hypothetical protein
MDLCMYTLDNTILTFDYVHSSVLIGLQSMFYMYFNAAQLRDLWCGNEKPPI